MPSGMPGYVRGVSWGKPGDVGGHRFRCVPAAHHRTGRLRTARRGAPGSVTADGRWVGSHGGRRAPSCPVGITGYKSGVVRVARRHRPKAGKRREGLGRLAPVAGLLGTERGWTGTARRRRGHRRRLGHGRRRRRWAQGAPAVDDRGTTGYNPGGRHGVGLGLFSGIVRRFGRPASAIASGRTVGMYRWEYGRMWGWMWGRTGPSG